jgi:hypothetical protein
MFIAREKVSNQRIFEPARVPSKIPDKPSAQPMLIALPYCGTSGRFWVKGFVLTASVPT